MEQMTLSQAPEEKERGKTGGRERRIRNKREQMQERDALAIRSSRLSDERYAREAQMIEIQYVPQMIEIQYVLYISDGEEHSAEGFIKCDPDRTIDDLTREILGQHDLDAGGYGSIYTSFLQPITVTVYAEDARHGSRLVNSIRHEVQGILEIGRNSFIVVDPRMSRTT